MSVRVQSVCVQSVHTRTYAHAVRSPGGTAREVHAERGPCTACTALSSFRASLSRGPCHERPRWLTAGPQDAVTPRGPELPACSPSARRHRGSGSAPPGGAPPPGCFRAGRGGVSAPPGRVAADAGPRRSGAAGAEPAARRPLPARPALGEGQGQDSRHFPPSKRVALAFLPRRHPLKSVS